MYIEGKNIKPSNNKEARQLIGKTVQYVCNCDIDKSGRGYYFPRTGTIVDVLGRNLVLENQDTIYFSNIVEMVILD